MMMIRMWRMRMNEDEDEDEEDGRGREYVHIIRVFPQQLRTAAVKGEVRAEGGERKGGKGSEAGKGRGPRALPLNCSVSEHC